MRKIRKASQLSQEDLAQRIGISQSTLSEYERGRLAVPDRVLKESWRIAARLRADNPAVTSACKTRIHAPFDSPSAYARHLEVCPHCLKWAHTMVCQECK